MLHPTLALILGDSPQFTTATFTQALQLKDVALAVILRKLFHSGFTAAVVPGELIAGFLDRRAAELTVPRFAGFVALSGNKSRKKGEEQSCELHDGWKGSGCANLVRFETRDVSGGWKGGESVVFPVLAKVTELLIKAGRVGW